MHILASVSEEESIKKMTLPKDTTVVISNEKEEPLRRIKLGDKGWFVDQDFVEEKRPFTKKEEKDYTSKLTRESVIDFFASFVDAKTPYREYSANSDAMYKFLKYIKKDSGGKYYDYDNKDYRVFNMFEIQLPKKGEKFDAKLFKEEFDLTVEALRKHHKDYIDKRGSIPYGIFEHTLSEGGIYELIAHSNGLFDVTKTVYGREQVLVTGLLWDQMVDWVRANAWYDF